MKEHGEVSRSYGSKKDEILAEIERSREVAKEAEVKVKELKEKIQRLEDDSWQMNTKYAEKMEKTLAKKAANGKNQAESDMVLVICYGFRTCLAAGSYQLELELLGASTSASLMWLSARFATFSTPSDIGGGGDRHRKHVISQ